MLYGSSESPKCDKPFTSLESHSEKTILEKCPEVASYSDSYSSYVLGVGHASEFPGNAASLFGHTFLVLIKKDDIVQSKTISFLAETKHSSFLKTIYFGLSGNFTGTYKRIPLYQLDSVYNGLESRTIRIFELNRQIYNFQRFLFGLYEFEKVKSDYYFLSYNCTSGTKALLNFGLYNRIPITFPDYPATAISFLRKDLVEVWRKETSVQTLSHDELISAEKKSEIRNILESDLLEKKIQGNNISEDKYISDLYNFLAFRSRTVSQYQKFSNKFQINPVDTEITSSSEKPFYSKNLTFGFLNSDKGTFAKLSFSPSYRDKKFEIYSDISNNHLQIFNFEILQGKRSYLNYFNFFEIETLNDYVWPLNKVSWKFNLKYDGVFNLNEKEHFHFSSLVGLSRFYSDFGATLLLGPRTVYMVPRQKSLLTLMTILRFQGQVKNFKISVDFEADHFNDHWKLLSFNPNLTLFLKRSFLLMEYKTFGFSRFENNQVSLNWGFRF